MSKFLRSERILKRTDFALAYRSRKKYFTKNFFLAFVDTGKRRLGVTVSTKVGNAVVRNRIKRVVREHFRLNKEMFPLGDSVVTARAGAGKLTGSEIRSEVSELIKKKN